MQNTKDDSLLNEQQAVYSLLSKKVAKKLLCTLTVGLLKLVRSKKKIK